MRDKIQWVTTTLPRVAGRNPYRIKIIMAWCRSSFLYLLRQKREMISHYAVLSATRMKIMKTLITCANVLEMIKKTISSRRLVKLYYETI
jgi:uncharacterized protein (DUF486 family)